MTKMRDCVTCLYAKDGVNNGTCVSCVTKYNQYRYNIDNILEKLKTNNEFANAYAVIETLISKFVHNCLDCPYYEYCHETGSLSTCAEIMISAENYAGTLKDD